MSDPKLSVVPAERIEQAILLLRGQKVMLDTDLARLYGVTVGRLNEAVKRNRERFPADFMFKLTQGEFKSLLSQIATAKRRGGRRTPPYAFTEHGVAMLSSVLNSRSAIQVNIGIMRTFGRLRRMLQANADLARRLDELERKYDKQFRVVFDAIRQLMMAPEEPPKQPIGFETESQAARSRLVRHSRK